VDPATDRTFCGAQADCAGPNDGVACSAQEVCSAGACLNNDATLSGLAVSHGELSPAFAPTTSLYIVPVLTFFDSVVVTPTATAGPGAVAITVNGTPVVSGSPSAPIALGTGGVTSITVRVVATSGAERSYGVVVVRGSPDSAYLKASNTGAGDRFGENSVAISGDTLVVGAPREASNASGVNPTFAADGITPAQSHNGLTRAGAVYVFIRVNGTWTQQAYIKASNPSGFDEFGCSVAIDGDTLVVGANEEDSASPGVNGDQFGPLISNSGAAYVFTRTQGTWSQEAYLKASNPQLGGNFGFSVAVEGDTIAVGSIGESSSAAGVNPTLAADGITPAQSDRSVDTSGAAYVFTRTLGTWTQQAYIKSSNPGQYDVFGWRVALSGDTLVVGAPYESSSAAGVNPTLAADGTTAAQADDSISGSGAVYVFTQVNGTWAQKDYIKASNSGLFDYFGGSLALSGDTLVVGAPYESSSARGVNPTLTPTGADAQSDNSAASSGAVYVFTRANGTWSQQAYIKSSNNPGARQEFGLSVALSGDTLVVGAPYDSSNATFNNGDPFDTSASGSGAAFVFVRLGGAWAERSYVKASNSAAGDLFGQCVAISMDTLAVSAPGEDSSATGENGDQADNSSLESGALYAWTPTLN
jgi:hypothetical protein